MLLDEDVKKLKLLKEMQERELRIVEVLSYFQIKIKIKNSKLFLIYR